MQFPTHPPQPHILPSSSMPPAASASAAGSAATATVSGGSASGPVSPPLLPLYTPQDLASLANMFLGSEQLQESDIKMIRPLEGPSGMGCVSGGSLWRIWIPAVTGGCLGKGRTREEAIEMALQAIRGLRRGSQKPSKTVLRIQDFGPKVCMAFEALKRRNSELRTEEVVEASVFCKERLFWGHVSVPILDINFVSSIMDSEADVKYQLEQKILSVLGFEGLIEGGCSGRQQQQQSQYHQLQRETQTPCGTTGELAPSSAMGGNAGDGLLPTPGTPPMPENPRTKPTFFPTEGTAYQSGQPGGFCSGGGVQTPLLKNQAFPGTPAVTDKTASPPGTVAVGSGVAGGFSGNAAKHMTGVHTRTEQFAVLWVPAALSGSLSSLFMLQLGRPCLLSDVKVKFNRQCAPPPHQEDAFGAALPPKPTGPVEAILAVSALDSVPPGQEGVAWHDCCKDQALLQALCNLTGERMDAVLAATELDSGVACTTGMGEMTALSPPGTSGVYQASNSIWSWTRDDGDVTSSWGCSQQQQQQQGGGAAEYWGTGARASRDMRNQMSLFTAVQDLQQPSIIQALVASHVLSDKVTLSPLYCAGTSYVRRISAALSPFRGAPLLNDARLFRVMDSSFEGGGGGTNVRVVLDVPFLARSFVSDGSARLSAAVANVVGKFERESVERTQSGSTQSQPSSPAELSSGGRVYDLPGMVFRPQRHVSGPRIPSGGQNCCFASHSELLWGKSKSMAV